MRSGSRVSANHAKAREKIDPLGTFDTPHQPNGLRSAGSYRSLPVSATGWQVPDRPALEGPRQRVAVRGPAPEANPSLTAGMDDCVLTADLDTHGLPDAAPLLPPF